MKSWFSITNKAESPAAEILIFEEIGLWGVSAKDFADALREIPKDRPIVVGINSPGGSVQDGVAIYNLLKSRDQVTTRIDGWAASIAGYIFCAGDRRIMSENTLFMLHNPSGGGFGESEEIQRLVDLLNKLTDQIAAHYSSVTGKPEPEIRKMMDAETWLTAAEAKAFGFATEISGGTGSKPATASFDFRRFKNGPKPIGGEPEGMSSNPQHNKMKVLLAALLEAKLIPSVDVSETEAVSAFNSAHKSSVEQNATLKKQVATQAKTIAESAVFMAVAAGKIKDDASVREKWVATYISAPEMTQALIDDAPISAKATKGTPPIMASNEKGTDVDSVVNEFAAIKNPACRTVFFNKNKTALMASLRKPATA